MGEEVISFLHTAGFEGTEADDLAATFQRHRLTGTPAELTELTDRKLLKTLGVTRAGDVLRITRAARALSATLRPPGYITISYRGSFAFGRDGLADVKFRKLTKILVSGRVALCREVFGDSLNESRDPDHGVTTDDRYTARFFLKHLMLEQAFDDLQTAGFSMVGSCGSGTSGTSITEPSKPGVDPEELRWNHNSEFVFCRQ